MEEDIFYDFPKREGMKQSIVDLTHYPVDYHPIEDKYKDKGRIEEKRMLSRRGKEDNPQERYYQDKIRRMNRRRINKKERKGKDLELITDNFDEDIQ